MPFICGSYEVSDANALPAALSFDEDCLAHYDRTYAAEVTA